MQKVSCLKKDSFTFKMALVEYEDLLPKNEQGSRTHLTCELCGFEPKTKNKYRERQDHLLRTHFMDRMTEIFPTFHHFNCPSSDCVFIGKDKQSLMRHYIRLAFFEGALRTTYTYTPNRALT